jgi:hypothetical protein
VVAAIGWSSHRLCCEHNDYLMQAVNRFPGRLVGLGMVQPKEIQNALAEIERINSGGLSGIGEFRPDLQALELSDENCIQPFMQLLRELDMVLMLHASEPVGHRYPGKGGLTPEVLYPFIEQYADNKIVLAHWGGGLPFYELQPEVNRVLGKVYYDSAATPFLYNPGIYRLAVELAGADRILFGSDYPLLAQQRALQQLAEFPLSSEARNRILALNALDLFGRMGPA